MGVLKGEAQGKDGAYPAMLRLLFLHCFQFLIDAWSFTQDQGPSLPDQGTGRIDKFQDAEGGPGDDYIKSRSVLNREFFNALLYDLHLLYSLLSDNMPEEGRLFP